MIILSWIMATLLAGSAHSYILLTANLDDMENIAKQVLDSPLAIHATQVYRRAANIFRNHVQDTDITKDLPQHPLMAELVKLLRMAVKAIKEYFKEKSKALEEDFKKDMMKDFLNNKKESGTKGHKKSRGTHRDNSYEERRAASSSASAEDDGDTRRTHQAHRPQRHHHNRKHYRPHRARRSDVAAPAPSEPAPAPSEPALAPSEPAPASLERRERLKETSEMVALGKNATRYLDTIKQIIENA